MHKVTCLAVALLLFILPSCKNAAGAKEKVAAKPASTAYLKNTPIAFNDAVLKTATDAVREFYADHNNTTVWTDKADRDALLQAIKEAEGDGLLPEDYHLNFLTQFEGLSMITEDECLRYDLMMTEAFRDLSTHLFKGKLKPQGVYNDWALAAKPFDAAKLQTEALQNHNIAEAINNCRPRHKVYSSLRNSLATLNALPDDSKLPQIVWEKAIKPNDSSATVGVVKQRLIYWGDLKLDTVNTKYDADAVAAVKKFQERHGMYPDGVVGRQTAEALNISRNQRREQVIVNLERWRWFPYQFGDRALLINIPTYKMAVLENGKDTVQTYRVVVGKPERRTPVLESKITDVVFNPTWTVPPTIIKEDLTPAATKDRAYFANHNMTIYKDGAQVLAEAWNPLEADKYRYVQGPGEDNALGRVKFNFRNSFSVYIHDTNHRNLFSGSYRALSSGCVRVQDPLKLAQYVLNGEDAAWDNSKIKGMVDAEATENVYIQKSIRVHQLYWTAWMDKGGLQFRDDIYSLDKILYDKLRGSGTEKLSSQAALR
ncbi:L,D-transpeptidase family protein [Flavobacterium sp. RHBU_24]|uniref:L,D-transpeptidase family protein n=1 Tax=Flavobacterium sp. RHBU_24 TaxID=3391185 RepID=UPI003984715A